MLSRLADQSQDGLKLSPLFTQLLLSEEQLRAGLCATVDGIYIPGDAIAFTSIRSSELAELLGISFQETFDDLDRCQAAVLALDFRFQVTLKEHRFSPEPGVEICAGHGGKSSRLRLAKILATLGLTRKQLTWIDHHAA
jgi:hypothetical protein